MTVRRFAPLESARYGFMGPAVLTVAVAQTETQLTVDALTAERFGPTWLGYDAAQFSRGVHRMRDDQHPAEVSGERQAWEAPSIVRLGDGVSESTGLLKSPDPGEFTISYISYGPTS